MTSKNATHRTPRSLSLSHDDHVSFFPPTILKNVSSISPVSARKLALLASLRQNANLIFKLWTIATPPSTPVYPLQLTKKKRTGISGSTNSPFGSWFMFPKSQNRHMSILYVDGTDANVHQNLLTSNAEVQTVASQDTKDCSLKYNTTTCMTLEENAKGLTSIFFFFCLFVCLFWKIER